MKIMTLFALAFALFPISSTALNNIAPESKTADSLTTGSGNRMSMVKETTIGCVPTPLPTVPIGPQWTYRIASSFPVGSYVGWDITFWRVPCQDPGDAQLLLTATDGNNFFCQHSIGIDKLSISGRPVVFDANPNNTSLDPPSCTNAPSSVVVSVDDFVFDDDGAIRFEWADRPYGRYRLTINIPPYDPAAYNTDLQLSGKLSGTYYDPGRSGEGLSVEIGRVGDRRVIFITWYTYSGGVQQWMAGNVDFPAGARQATIPLVVTTGGQFGPLFTPSQVSATSWGTVTVRFPSCTTMQFEWSKNGGQSGAYNYQRLMEGLEGITCP